MSQDWFWSQDLHLWPACRNILQSFGKAPSHLWTPRWFLKKDKIIWIKRVICKKKYLQSVLPVGDPCANWEWKTSLQKRKVEPSREFGMTQDTEVLAGGVKEQLGGWVVTERLHKIASLMANDGSSCQCYQHLIPGREDDENGDCSLKTDCQWCSCSLLSDPLIIYTVA